MIGWQQKWQHAVEPGAPQDLGTGALVRSPKHHALLEHAVLERFTTQPRCPRSANRPPSAPALASATTLRGIADPPPRPLAAYAALVEAPS